MGIQTIGLLRSWFTSRSWSTCLQYKRTYDSKLRNDLTLLGFVEAVICNCEVQITHAEKALTIPHVQSPLLLHFLKRLDVSGLQRQLSGRKDSTTRAKSQWPGMIKGYYDYYFCCWRKKNLLNLICLSRHMNVIWYTNDFYKFMCLSHSLTFINVWKFISNLKTLFQKSEYLSKEQPFLT